MTITMALFGGFAGYYFFGSIGAFFGAIILGGFTNGYNSVQNGQQNSSDSIASNDTPTDTGFNDSGLTINPASGLPMVDSAIDVAGNPYGADSSHDIIETDMEDSVSFFEDSYSSSSFDDDFDTGASNMDDNW